MKQIATVIKNDGQTAVVSVMRSSMCDGCHKNCDGGCSMYKIFGGDKRFEAVAKNDAGAKAGDCVYVETPDKNVLVSAFVVFIAPIALAFLFYSVFLHFWGNAVGVAAGAVSFLVYFAILAFTEKIRRKRSPEFVITETVKKALAGVCDYGNG